MTAGSRYSDQQRREAVTLYLLHGNWKQVAALTAIPQRTLNDWAMQPWFATLLAEVRAEKGAELDGSYTRIIHEATDQLLDRLKNGDAYVAGGEVKRKPVSARDLALVAAISFDKRQLSRNLPTLQQQPMDTTELAKALQAYARANPIEGNVRVEYHGPDSD